MNSYKLNGQAGHHYRQAICKGLHINHTEIYKTVKDIDKNGIITTCDGRKYSIELRPIIIFNLKTTSDDKKF